MKKLLISVIAAFTIAGCQGSEKIIYVDKETGAVIAPVKLMPHKDAKLVCIEGHQTYQLYQAYGYVYLWAPRDAYGSISKCDANTKADGEQL